MLTLLSMGPSTKACLINSITVELLKSSMLIQDQLVLLLKNKSSKENLRRKSMLELNISDTLILDLLSYKESKKMTRRKLKLKNKAWSFLLRDNQRDQKRKEKLSSQLTKSKLQISFHILSYIKNLYTIYIFLFPEKKIYS